MSHVYLIYITYKEQKYKWNLVYQINDQNFLQVKSNPMLTDRLSSLYGSIILKPYES
jgi:hypothetical protein